jgi:hypothetical protein
MTGSDALANSDGLEKLIALEDGMLVAHDQWPSNHSIPKPGGIRRVSVERRACIASRPVLRHWIIFRATIATRIAFACCRSSGFLTFLCNTASQSEQNSVPRSRSVELRHSRSRVFQPRRKPAADLQRTASQPGSRRRLPCRVQSGIAPLSPDVYYLDIGCGSGDIEYLDHVRQRFSSKSWVGRRRRNQSFKKDSVCIFQAPGCGQITNGKGTGHKCTMKHSRSAPALQW